MGAVKGKPGYNLDAPELIGQCLRCTKPECDNCLERSAGANARRAFDRWEELIELYNAGVIYRDIGARLGVSKEKAGRLCALAVRMDWFGTAAITSKGPRSGAHAIASGTGRPGRSSRRGRGRSAAGGWDSRAKNPSAHW